MIVFIWNRCTSIIYIYQSIFNCDIESYEKCSIDLFRFACLSCLHMFLKSEVYLHMSRMSFPGFNHILRTDMIVTYNFAAFMSLIKSKNRERVEYLYNVQWCFNDVHVILLVTCHIWIECKWRYSFKWYQVLSMKRR